MTSAIKEIDVKNKEFLEADVKRGAFIWPSNELSRKKDIRIRRNRFSRGSKMWMLSNSTMFV